MALGRSVEAASFFDPGSIWIPYDKIPTCPLLRKDEVEYYLADERVRLRQGLRYTFKNYHYAFAPNPRDSGAMLSKRFLRRLIRNSLAMIPPL